MKVLFRNAFFSTLWRCLLHYHGKLSLFDVNDAFLWHIGNIRLTTLHHKLAVSTVKPKHFSLISYYRMQ